MGQKKNQKPAEPDPAKKPEKTEEPNPITDPQESMEGPVSSVIQAIKHRAEKNDEKEQKEHEYKQSHSGGDFINK